jgi:outer membrane lipoprotein-sorting protein
MNDNKKNIEQLLEDLTFDDTPDLRHQNLLEQKLLLNFNLLNFKTVGSRQNSKWRIIMNMKMAKLAAAAVLLIGVFVGFGLFDGTSSVSWAQVRGQVAAVKAVVYKAKVNVTENGQPLQLQIQATLADEYGTRMDTYMGTQLVGRSFTLADKKSQISIFPKQEKYIEVALTEKNRIENGDPKLIVEAFLQGDYKELGRREINGVTLKGIQSDDVSPTGGFPGGRGLMDALKHESSAKVLASLWVDIATGWPVEITMDITDEDGNEQMTIVVSDFQWDTQIDPATFASIIPEGYTPMYKVNAEHLEKGNQLIDGLKYFAQINDGKYPTKLSIRDVVGEIGNIYRAKSGDPSFRIDDAQVSTLKYGAQYFQSLHKDGKDPVYYGPTVTPNDANKVLLRWKLSDGQYRVILGDLQIKDVDAAQLAQLEAQ